ncbi:hypothetical protein Tsubulata_013522 [Turnera subulata]|nr:hypothetical protein Tsubulata_013522 [Turnera subulata]
MAGGRRTAAAGRNAPARGGLDNEDDAVIVLEDDGDDKETASTESEISRLRGRWELASVLNFLNVFEPVIGSDPKLTAEDIETSLIKPNAQLSQLHIKLLKGIPPVNKKLNDPGAWVTILCNKLAMWWPWVAEGKMPISAAKGKEKSDYKELDATTRLLILKALCELRAEQDDIMSYINDALKNGTEISCFRKDNIGGDGKGTCYWYDGSTVTGYRLYREIKESETKAKMKGQASKSLPAVCFQWETIATDLEEFQNVVGNLSSSKFGAEAAVGKTIENDVLPLVEKFQKKKERVLKQKERQEKLQNDTRRCSTRSTRSCRNNRAVCYTYAEYDRAIDEAIKVTMKRKRTEEPRNETKHFVKGKCASSGGSDMYTDSEGTEAEKGSSDIGDMKKSNSLDSESESDRLQKPKSDDEDVDSESESDRLQQPKMDDEDNDVDYDVKEDNKNGSESGNSDEEKENLGNMNRVQKHFGPRWSRRLAGGSDPPDVETRNLVTKHRLRQRPVRNSALDSILDGADDTLSVVPDSEDENLSNCTNSETSAQEDLSEVADSVSDA